MLPISFSGSGEGEGGNYLTQFYNGKPSTSEADPVPVTAPGTTSGIDAEMRPGGQISGRVTDASKVHASSKAIKALNAGRTLHVSGPFTFQSALGGAPVTHVESAVVRKPKKPRKHAKGKKH